MATAGETSGAHIAAADRVAGRFLRWMVEFLLPGSCLGCGERLPPDDSGAPPVCRRCLTRLAPLPHPRCPRCDLPRGTGGGDGHCPECSGWPHEPAAVRSAVALVPPADRLVHALKYDGWPAVASVMAHRMADIPLPEPPPGSSTPPLVVPIPTTRRRERRRGYNQARILAAEYGRIRGLALLEGLERVEGGTTQVALHPSRRRDNVHGAFRLRTGAVGEVEGRRLVLIDDVLTTGATALEAARVLHSAGSLQVTLVTFARALPGRERGRRITS